VGEWAAVSAVKLPFVTAVQKRPAWRRFVSIAEYLRCGRTVARLWQFSLMSRSICPVSN